MLLMVLGTAGLRAQTNFLDFDGSNDQVTLNGTMGGTSWTEITVEAWVNTDGPNGTFQAILSSNNFTFVHFQLLSSGNNVAYTDVGTIDLPIIPENHGTWQHVAVVYKSGASAAYVNGVQLGATETTTFGHILPHTNPTIGRGYTGRYFNGKIDELRVWRVARTAAEIQSTMNTELAGNEPGLEAYYKFNQGNCGGNNAGLTQLTDHAAGGNHNGQLNNFAMNGCNSNIVCDGATCNFPPNGVQPRPNQNVPTLSEWSLVVLALLFLCMGAVYLRSRSGLSVAGTK